MKLLRDILLLFVCLAIACLAMLLVGCATAKTSLLPVEKRDCHIENFTILFFDPMIIDILGSLSMGDLGPDVAYVGLAVKEKGTIFVTPGDKDTIYHEILHLCTQSEAEDAALDERDSFRR